MATVTVRSDFGAQENKICHFFLSLPLYFPWNNGTGYHDLSFLNVEFQVSFFHAPISSSSGSSSVPPPFLAFECYQLHTWGCWYSSQKSWFQLVIHWAQYFVRCTLHISLKSSVAVYRSAHSFPNFKPVSYSMGSSNCCFLTPIQVSRETGKVVCYSHL